MILKLINSILFILPLLFYSGKDKAHIILHESNCLPCISKAINYLEKEKLLDNTTIILLYKTRADKEKNLEDLQSFELLNGKKVSFIKNTFKFNKTKITIKSYGPTLIIEKEGKKTIFYVTEIDGEM